MAVSPKPLPASEVLAKAIGLLQLPPEQLLRECKVESTIGGGPGGQHRNRRHTGIRLSHGPSGLSVVADRHREPLRNKKEAVWRLRLELALSLKSLSPLDDEIEEILGFVKGTASDLNGRLGKPIAVAHDDYALAVALALAALAMANAELGAAAALLGVGSSRLSKLLSAEKLVLAAANQVRARFGRLPLKRN